MDTRTDWQKRVGVRERQVRFGVHAGNPRDIQHRDPDGRVEAVQTEHWDGHVDCTIRPKTTEFQIDVKHQDYYPKEPPKTERIFT
jgi:hypothetical protein